MDHLIEGEDTFMCMYTCARCLSMNSSIWPKGVS